MSVRRRAIQERLQREETRERQYDETTAFLTDVQTVVDSFKAEGRTTITQEEFAARLNAIRSSESENDAV